jgi:TPR repeat protein
MNRSFARAVIAAVALNLPLSIMVAAPAIDGGRGADRDGANAGALRQRAERGEADAQYRLGTVYEYGRGVHRDDAEALKWYVRAARQGYDDAQYRLGVMYDNGWGVAIDDRRAAAWYRDAAEQGHALAQHDLAFMYFAGTGVPHDLVRAYMWLDIAVAGGNAVMIKHRAHVAASMTSAQVDQARRLASVWLRGNAR